MRIVTYISHPQTGHTADWTLWKTWKIGSNTGDTCLV